MLFEIRWSKGFSQYPSCIYYNRAVGVAPILCALYFIRDFIKVMDRILHFKIFIFKINSYG